MTEADSEEGVTVSLRLPKLGESILNATVVQWLKDEGELVAEDEPLLEVATDKVNSEIPSPVAGRLIKIVAQPDSTVEVGEVLATIQSGAAEADEPEPEYHSDHAHSPSQATTGFLSPAVLRLVREREIPLAELEKIQGTGDGGRITKKDIESYLVARWGGKKTGASTTCEQVERLAMSPMRKAIAENMTRSFYQAPHAYILTEVGVTRLMNEIAQAKEAFLAKHQVKLTITSFLIKALAQAATAHPLLNASLEDDTVVVRKQVNVGIAVAVDNGLVVPVIKSCEQSAIASIATALVDTSKRARSGQLKPDEVTSGTITLTNFGMSGALMGLPIIRHPEVGIVGIGAVQKRLVVQDDDSIAVRKIVHATLSFDHRVVDGMYAGAFLATFRKSLEEGEFSH